MIALRAEDRQIEHDREQDGQAARHQHVGAEVDVREQRGAEAAGAGQEGERGEADQGRGGDPQPGHDLRQRERQLDLPQQLARRQAHAAARVARLGDVRSRR